MAALSNAEAEAALQAEIRLFPKHSQAYARLAILSARNRHTVREVLSWKRFRGASWKQGIVWRFP